MLKEYHASSIFLHKKADEHSNQIVLFMDLSSDQVLYSQDLLFIDYLIEEQKLIQVNISIADSIDIQEIPSNEKSSFPSSVSWGTFRSDISG